MSRYDDLSNEYLKLKRTLETDKTLPVFAHELVKLIDISFEALEEYIADVEDRTGKDFANLEDRLDNV